MAAIYTVFQHPAALVAHSVNKYICICAIYFFKALFDSSHTPRFCVNSQHVLTIQGPRQAYRMICLNFCTILQHCLARDGSTPKNVLFN
jgi:hypothetical protein